MHGGNVHCTLGPTFENENTSITWKSLSFFMKTENPKTYWKFWGAKTEKLLKKKMEMKTRLIPLRFLFYQNLNVTIYAHQRKQWKLPFGALKLKLQISGAKTILKCFKKQNQKPLCPLCSKYQWSLIISLNYHERAQCTSRLHDRVVYY